MRILRSFFKRLGPCAVTLALPLLCRAADKPGNVLLQYHFIGATQLAQNPSVASAKKVFALGATIDFKAMVLNRQAVNIATELQFPTYAKTASLLRPLLDDALVSESMINVAGTPGQPLDFVFAIQLDKDRAQTWQQNLKKNNGPGEEFSAESFSGWQWNKGSSSSFWLLPAQGWLVMGTGEGLASVRSDYLQQIQKTGRPAPALDFNCFEADVDWPRLTNWFPLSSCPLKLGRTQVAIGVENGAFHMTCQITYPEAIQWQPHPMSLPTNLVHEPLTSFCTGQNVEPFLKSDESLSRLPTNPLSDQFYFWSMGEMPLQSYVAWPCKDPSNTMVTLSAQAIDALSPKLQLLNGSELDWVPLTSQLIWTKLQMVSPLVQAAPADAGQFLIAGLFPLTPGKSLAPPGLWEQFDGRPDLVYYDWELTGARIRHLLTVTQTIPILQMLGVGPRDLSALQSKTPAGLAAKALLNVQEIWLSSLSPILGNTVTEVTKTGPSELTVIRNSSFVFSSLELLLLCHWLSDTPAGPLDWSLLPKAKISGPGIPAH